MSDQEIQAVLRKARAEGWERGFLDGCQYGRAVERYDPNDWGDEPAQPANPYEPRSHKA